MSNRHKSYSITKHKMASSILLRNGTVLSHDGDKVVVLKGHDILVNGSTIKQIGQGLTLAGEGRVIDCTNKIISPGFIDTHHHMWQTQVRPVTLG